MFHKPVRFLFAGALALALVVSLLPAQGVSFALDKATSPQTLALNTTLTWNTFLGASGEDSSYAIALDASGNIYVTGNSQASWGSPIGAFDNLDVFVAKLDSSGNLLWNTFLGGSDADLGSDIAVDKNGNVYVMGFSFATWGTPVRPHAVSGYDVFVAKLTPSGSLTWNTFLGGSADEQGQAIAVDGSDNVYVTGASASSWGSPIRAYTASAYDAFAAKLTPSGALTWNTFLGGSASDSSYGIAVDGTGTLSLSGTSQGSWGTPVRAYIGGGAYGNDAFAAKLTTSGNLLWNTFLGGNEDDFGAAAVVDVNGHMYMAGTSSSTWGSPIQAFIGAGTNDFAVKLDPSGNVSWNTFLGGNSTDSGNGIALDGMGNLYLAGSSQASWGNPTEAYTGDGSDDAWAAQFTPAGALAWNTFLGTTGFDYGFDIAVDGNQKIYVTGQSSNTWGNPIRSYTASFDAFVAKVTPPVPTFADVLSSYWAWSYIERLYNAGITGGCSLNPLQYCPESIVTRAQMAVFLLRGIHGASYTPPGVGAGTGFGDVPPSYWSATFIKQLAAEGITTGCGGGNYCPEHPVTRAQMAVFLLRSKHGPGYTPPPVGSGPNFTDVPPGYWAADWIKQLVVEGITSGCGPSTYCPEQPVTRAQMAVFLVRTFSLP